MKVFIVDDDPITVTICERTMQVTEFAHDIISFQDGREALQYLKHAIKEFKSLPDTIFLDLNMPGMNGWEFLDHFQKLNFSGQPAPDVYILSSSVDPSEEVKGYSYKYVKGFISKPLTSVKLEEIKSHYLVSK